MVKIIYIKDTPTPEVKELDVKTTRRRNKKSSVDEILSEFKEHLTKNKK